MFTFSFSRRPDVCADNKTRCCLASTIYTYTHVRSGRVSRVLRGLNRSILRCSRSKLQTNSMCHPGQVTQNFALSARDILFVKFLPSKNNYPPPPPAPLPKKIIRNPSAWVGEEAEHLAPTQRTKHRTGNKDNQQRDLAKGEQQVHRATADPFGGREKVQRAGEIEQGSRERHAAANKRSRTCTRRRRTLFPRVFLVLASRARSLATRRLACCGRPVARDPPPGDGSGRDLPSRATPCVSIVREA